MLQHGVLDDWTYSVRTLQDHVSLVSPALLRELNARLVREGHAVAAWLALCGDLTGRLGVTLEALAGLPEGSVSPA